MNNRSWDLMNDLDLTSNKICSAREIIESAIDRIQQRQYDKAEILMNSAYEFLGYYLNDFDEKFKLAWKETIVKQKVNDYNALSHQSVHYTEEELDAMCHKAEKENKKKKIL